MATTNVNKRIDQLTQAVEERQTMRLVDITKPFRDAIRKVYGSDPGSDRVQVGPELLATLHKVYGGEP